MKQMFNSEDVSDVPSIQAITEYYINKFVEFGFGIVLDLLKSCRPKISNEMSTHPWEIPQSTLSSVSMETGISRETICHRNCSDTDIDMLALKIQIH